MQHHLPADQIIVGSAFTDFRQAANSFCKFIEQAGTTTGVDFLRETRSHLVHLYGAAMNLPWVDLQSDVDFAVQLDQVQFNTIQSKFAERLGGTRFYWHVLDPTYEKPTEAVCGDLIDDLQDMYKDLKHSLMTLDLGLPACEENALWQFKFDFEKHWGVHCINALSAIHFFLQHEW